MLGALLIPDAADAAFPGLNGKIAFTSDRDASLQIYTVSPDGTGETRLTSDSGPNTAAAWSPRGERIAFRCEAFGEAYLCVMNSDGSGRHFVLVNDQIGDLTDPAWAPGGSRLAFAWERITCDDTGDCNLQDDLGQVNDDGSGVTTFSRPLSTETEPAWHPDGSRIAYTGDFSEIDTVEPDWTGRTPIVPIGSDPNWSPDGSKIVFWRFADYPNGEIFVVNADGSNETRLTNNTVWDGSPAWSPDGTKIAFSSSEGGDYEIFVMNSDGSGRTQLTENTAADVVPDWQPIPNHAPDCSGVRADPSILWPPNRRFRVVELAGASDPDGDDVTLEITGVTQDEPVGGSRDAFGAAGELVRLRAERDPRGDGRVYQVAFTATDSRGAQCDGTARVAVPLQRRRAAVDSAPPSYDSFGR